MTFRGILLLLAILIFIPVFFGKVSAGEFIDLLKSPTNVTMEQWRGAAVSLLEDVYNFYKNWGLSIYQRFRPEAEEKLKELKIDEALLENKEFLREGLELLEKAKPPQ